MLIVTFILLNSLANAPPIKEPDVRSTAVSETAAVLLCFLSDKAELPMKQKNGDRKNEPTRLGTLGQANAKAFTTTK
jgi:hypothetical protein